ncbi:MAG: hypothetical protein JWN38_265 [Candidatus Saccharibacteria bacterium]|nr:hypothetical protein [Candidatus Saccharibacteria bacterium]
MPKYLGLVLVLVSWVLAVRLLLKWRDKNLKTISHHAASSIKARLLFLVTLTALGMPFYLWVQHFLTPVVSHSVAFEILLILTFSLQTITALAPDTFGVSRLVHRASAYSLAFFYFPLDLLMVLSGELSEIARFYATVVAIYMLFTMIWVSILKKYEQHFIIFQTLYIVGIQSALLVAVYIH